MTSDLQEGDPELETSSTLEFAGACIHGSIDECNSWRFPTVYQWKRVWSEVSRLVISGLDRGRH